MLDEVALARLREELKVALEAGPMPQRKAIIQSLVAEIRVKDRSWIQPSFAYQYFDHRLDRCPRREPSPHPRIASSGSRSAGGGTNCRYRDDEAPVLRTHVREPSDDRPHAVERPRASRRSVRVDRRARGPVVLPLVSWPGRGRMHPATSQSRLRGIGAPWKRATRASRGLQ